MRLIFHIFLLAVSASCSPAAGLQQNEDDQRQQEMLILVPKGDDPETAKNRVLIPLGQSGKKCKTAPKKPTVLARNGQQPPLPCLVSGAGVYENGQTFTKGNFHYFCKNGTAEVIACVAEDMSVIQIGRTFLRNGIRHKCDLKGETVVYEQRSTCYENAVHYDIGEKFKNGSFQLACKQGGVAIIGCFLMNSTEDEVLLLGESRILGNRKHTCEVTEAGKIRYVINVLGCRNGTDEYKPGQTWADKHIRYQCSPEGIARVLGCTDETGLFIELGHDILMGGTVHRCYKVGNTTYYHRFQCARDRSLTECIHSNYVPKQPMARAKRNNLQQE